MLLWWELIVHGPRVPSSRLAWGHFLFALKRGEPFIP